ncbi:hypothetical protein R3P38DRAFT_3601148 [Favolaschia claudopus]|uniref:Uncharacterized protein n=1 Tax=Favolaschia claudopus TaxID=2862362 RepID=A0AAW0ABP7_9AGAR
MYSPVVLAARRVAGRRPYFTSATSLIIFNGLPSRASVSTAIEVPLRAKHVGAEMRGMMSVFRINPFVFPIQGGSSQALYEARPLDQEPLSFEFQLEMVMQEGGQNEPVHQPAQQKRTEGLSLASSTALNVLSEPYQPDWMLTPGEQQPKALSVTGSDAVAAIVSGCNCPHCWSLLLEEIQSCVYCLTQYLDTASPT